MAVLTVAMYAILIVVALLLIGLILIQPSKSGGMGATFGGIGESVFGGKAGSHLTKTTIWLTTIFFAVALILAVLIGHGATPEVPRDNTAFREGMKQAEEKAVPDAQQKTTAKPAAEKPAAQQKTTAKPAAEKK